MSCGVLLHRTPRTYLFVPGHRPDRVAKALASGADRIVVDLEDAVPESHKAEARQLLAGYGSSPERTVIRINAWTSGHAHADLAACRAAHLHTIMVPKADATTTRTVASTGSELRIIALIESAAGLLSTAATAAQPQVIRLALGAEDLAAELGIDPTDRAALAHPMSTVVVGSAAARLPGPIAPVTVVLDDSDAVMHDAAASRSHGFRAKLLIHPSQDQPARMGLSPTEAETRWAQAVLHAADGRQGATVGVGQMLDAPVVDRARRIVQESLP
jgi:citrate lyase subunit beta/citryl-CoA lyase